MKKYEIENGLIVAENYDEKTQFPVIMKKWTSPDGALTRYYVTRAGEKIGWISEDKKTGKGQGSSTNQHYINKMIEALNA